MSGLLLVDLDSFKSYKGITKPDDARLTMILESVSNFTKTYCKRSFIDYYSMDKVELKNASEHTEIFLDELPLQSITSIEVSLDGDFTGTDPDKITTLIEYEDYYPNIENSSIISTQPLAYSGILNVSNLRITYKAGYKTTPKDLKMAILDFVEYQYSEEFVPRKSFKDMSIENLGFREGTASLPSHIKRIFEMYRRLE